MSKKAKKPCAPAALANLLVSLDEKGAHLEEVGSRSAAARMIELASERLALAAQDEVALAELGFDAAWRKALEAAVGDVRSRAQDRSASAIEARPSGHATDALVEEARAWLRRYSTVVHNSGPEIRGEAPRVTHGEHAPKRLAAELERLADFVADRGKETHRHGGGRSFADRGRELAERLRAAREEHEAARAELPDAVRELQRALGVVCLELGRLSRAAHDVLPHDRARAYALDAVKPRGHAANGHGNGNGNGHARPREHEGNGAKKSSVALTAPPGAAPGKGA